MLYGHVDFVRDVARPVEALPPGFPAYTVVLHRLFDEGPRRRWLDDQNVDPWVQMRSVQTEGIGDDRFVADVPLKADPATARCLADVLGIGDVATDYTICVFASRIENWTLAASSDAMAGLLRHMNTMDTALGRPNMWYPHTRAWAANAPYDMGCTYIASDRSTAEKLRNHPGLETLICKRLRVTRGRSALASSRSNRGGDSTLGRRS